MTDEHGEGVWRRRERGWTVGMILWAVCVGLVGQFAQPQFVSFVSETAGIGLAATAMVTMGLAAGIGEGVMILLSLRTSEVEAVA